MKQKKWKTRYGYANTQYSDMNRKQVVIMYKTTQIIGMMTMPTKASVALCSSNFHCLTPKKLTAGIMTYI